MIEPQVLIVIIIIIYYWENIKTSQNNVIIDGNHFITNYYETSVKHTSIAINIMI